MPKQHDLDHLYIDLSARIARMSYARRLKVGAVVVKGTNIISMGWNGTPAGEDNNCEDENPDGTLVTKPSVIHAEYNSVKKLRDINEDGKLNGATLYCTLSPCFSCSALIIESKIKRVVYLDEYRIVDGIIELRKNNIQVDRWNELS